MDTLDKKLTQVKNSQTSLAQTSTALRNQFLVDLANILKKQTDAILYANKKDVTDAKEEKKSGAFIQRLSLTKYSVIDLIKSLQHLQSLPDPIGVTLEKKHLKNRVNLQKVSIPLGVLLVIYESRPEVTIHAAALSIKSGNCAVLKGGSEALNTNKIFAGCIRNALVKSGLPTDCVTVLFDVKRAIVAKLLQRIEIFDLVIARGGYRMVEEVSKISKIPVLSHSVGGARIYVDQSANIERAIQIIIDAKVTKPAACNSVDTVLVHDKIASAFIPKLSSLLREHRVVIHDSSNAPWDREFLGSSINIGVVANVHEAIKHIEKFGKDHSEGIIAQDKLVIDLFVKHVDAAGVFINCSTRLHDGGVFGMGLEMGISTGKLHARGPVGLRELTSYKWIAYGEGQTRVNNFYSPKV